MSDLGYCPDARSRLHVLARKPGKRVHTKPRTAEVRDRGQRIAEARRDT
jgi:hypothetical protein